MRDTFQPIGFGRDHIETGHLLRNVLRNDATSSTHGASLCGIYPEAQTWATVPGAPLCKRCASSQMARLGTTVQAAALKRGNVILFPRGRATITSVRPASWSHVDIAFTVWGVRRKLRLQRTHRLEVEAESLRHAA